MEQGRLTSAPRLMGRLGFVHVFRAGGFFQISSNADLPTWETFRSLSQGDIVEYTGEDFITKTGEPTVRVTELNVLRRCELSLPDRMAGVSVGIARQQPYLNLLSEVVSKDRNLPYREALILRAEVLRSIREFMHTHGFMEVTTPTLIDNAFGCDAKPFETEGRYLRIAPELELKKLVVGGFDRIYEIGKSFRNEGVSQKHNPEFTMLEFYGGGDHTVARGYTVELLLHIIHDVVPFGDVHGINWKKFHHIFMSESFDESAVVDPTFVAGFTAEDSPLAKIGSDGFAERFELYVGGMELANGYSEQDDWRIQQKAFERQGVVDTDYIDALKRGLPPIFGVGIGIDRLIMLLTNRNIKEVI